MSINNTISIIVPAHNEEKSIYTTITNLHKVMGQTEYTYEIIAVNDGSTDNTYEELQKADAQVIHNNYNLGYGASLKLGIRHSNFDTIVITDADGTYPEEEILKLLDNYFIYNCDMVVGARTGENVNIPLIRKPAKWCLTTLAKYLTRIDIPDLNSGLRVMKKTSVIPFFNVISPGFSFTTTVTLALHCNDYLVRYIPINYLKRQGKSKIKPVRDTIDFFQKIFRIVMYFKPLKIFAPIALIPGFFGLVFLIRDLIKMNLAQTSILMLLTSFMILSIGLLADLIDKRLVIITNIEK
ncbi:MAG: glycosyltransferase family 2 protein [Candidatus Theseobacter exili]|nr:glycosyltransferase family 2 protein [Candidatus Theseobacter exili]